MERNTMAIVLQYSINPVITVKIETSEIETFKIEHNSEMTYLFLLMNIDFKFGSYNRRPGFMSIGDCRCPLLHRNQSGFNMPQNSGPAK